MNAIVVYSSQTGRTKQIAQAVVSGLPEGTPCVSVDEMPKDLSGYDCVFVGFWSDKDQADPKGQEALRQIKNDNVAVLQPFMMILILTRLRNTCAVLWNS